MRCWAEHLSAADVHSYADIQSSVIASDFKKKIFRLPLLSSNAYLELIFNTNNLVTLLNVISSIHSVSIQHSVRPQQLCDCIEYQCWLKAFLLHMAEEKVHDSYIYDI